MPDFEIKNDGSHFLPGNSSPPIQMNDNEIFHGSSPPSANMLNSDAAIGSFKEEEEKEEEVKEKKDMLNPGVIREETETIKAIKKYDDLFAADDDDDELEFQAKDLIPNADMSRDFTNSSSKVDQVSPEEMLQFYQRLFPYRYFFQWLNHSPSPSPDFTHREIAFTLQSDIYSRYNSFKGYEDFKKEVLRLNPLRFEIGPQYTANPRDKKLLRKGAFRPLTKELVFDIDLTDYDEIRTCCSKTQICIKCWQFITVAIRTMTLGLKEDFGFKNIIWIFSGRRGAHAWVCDKRARELDDQKRRAIAHYFALSRNGTTVKKRMNLKRPLHPHISRSLEILKDDFQVNILEEQDPWETNDGENILLNLLPERNTELNKELRAFWLDNPGRTSYKKWKDIDDFAKKGVQKNLSTKELQYAKQDIILQYMYPRLDIEVSNKLNHLLKSPFVVHPKTGKVCVPIELDNYEDFDPEDVPTVDQLLNEIDSFNKELNESKDEMADIKISDYEKTSLKIYIDYFAKFVKSVMEEEAEIKKTFSAGKRSLDF